MPNKSVDVLSILKRLQAQEIMRDQPLIVYTREDGDEFTIFQSSGLNLLTGQEGNGKTKFLSLVALEILCQFSEPSSPLSGYKILYVDTERAECQFAFTIGNIFEGSEYDELGFANRFHFLSVLDLKPNEIRDSILSHLKQYHDHRFVIFVDPIIPLVHDMNSVIEASEIDSFIKSLICQSHLVVASIHKPAGADRALGQIGSTLQRFSSSIVDISNCKERSGFNIKVVKSRISALSKLDFFIPKDVNGDIDLGSITTAQDQYSPEDPDKIKLAKSAFELFLHSRTRSKKVLLKLIRKAFKMKDQSSNAYRVFKRYLSRFVHFNKDEAILTDEGKQIEKNLLEEFERVGIKPL